MSYVQWFIRSQTVCLPSQLCVINHTQRAMLLGLEGQAFLGIIFIHCWLLFKVESIFTGQKYHKFACCLHAALFCSVDVIEFNCKIKCMMPELQNTSAHKQHANLWCFGQYDKKMTSWICKMTYESVIQIHFSFHYKIVCMMPAIQIKCARKQHANLWCFWIEWQVEPVKWQMNL